MLFPTAKYLPLVATLSFLPETSVLSFHKLELEGLLIVRIFTKVYPNLLLTYTLNVVVLDSILAIKKL